MRGGWRPLPGLICEFFSNSIGQGNFTFLRKKVSKFQTSLAVATMALFPLTFYYVITYFNITSMAAVQLS